VVVQTSLPPVVIISPTQFVTSDPKFVLIGRTDRLMEKMSYNQFDQNGVLAGSGLGRRTGVEFACPFIELKRGTNTLALRIEDEAGNITVTNLVVFCTTADAANSTAPAPAHSSQ
jgi:hypothetical protein